MKNEDPNSKSIQDAELAKLLNPLRQIQADSKQLERWKSAIHLSSVTKRRTGFSNFSVPYQLVAAMLVGFILGAAVMQAMKASPADLEWTQNLTQDATFERTRTNLN